MNVRIRLPQELVERVRADLSRPHPFAGERVGFLFGRLAAADGALVLMTQYQPLPDERYIDDPYAGARIDSQAIRTGMQSVLDLDQGAFHVHLHHWGGYPMMSRMDAEEIPRVITGFRRAGPQHAHGILLMHDEECAAWVWLPGQEEEIEAEAVSVVGFPFRFFKRWSHEQ